MNYRGVLGLILVAATGAALAKDKQDCGGCVYPFNPDPPCVNICMTQALNLATKEDLRNSLHFDDSTVSAIVKAREGKPIGSLDDLKGTLTGDEIKKLNQTLNSKAVAPIFDRQKAVLNDSDAETLKTRYKLDDATTNAILDARRIKSPVTIQDLDTTRLSDQQKLQVTNAIRSAHGSVGPNH